ncbi:MULTISPECIES: STAS domain-containing protein [Methanoculleus]|uniref:Anti-anti-sigma regulatory factor, SpoIIAA n=2 Tax=Methanoculleus TaxID=45989 RepID=A3CYD8_METMJ|nr:MULTISPECIES: STAS domain-containing protein [Methanoculleus]ABN58388.1 anti-anti-sigma regulatory factor, SpoIIAA [Methanoculleus marisnigri JR1]MCC7554628.1 STAS domain-containing protein [Methanoculleus marisnigri]UYU17386.1 STAS domain-containing protein [Methanoculleus submarinus]
MSGHFEITEEKAGTVDIVTMKGRLDAGSSETAQERINRVLDAGGRNLLVNLCDLDYISSSGLRVLLATLKRLKTNGGALRIACAQPQILEVFTMAGFHRIFSLSPDEATALAGFPAGS